MSSFEVGQWVGVCRNGQCTSFRKVVRVMKRFIELSDGTKYRPAGTGTYPYTRGCGQSITPVTEEKMATIRDGWTRRKWAWMIAEFHGEKWEKVSAEDLATVIRIFEAAQEGAE